MVKHIKGTIYTLKEMVIILRREGLKGVPDILDPRGWYYDINGKKVYGTMYSWIKHYYMHDVRITTENLELSK